MPSLILIPRWAKGDSAYLAHEQCHAAQQREIGTVLFWWRYLADKDTRKLLEVEAYKAQIEAGASVHECALRLMKGYRLGISMEKAMKELSL